MSKLEIVLASSSKIRRDIISNYAVDVIFCDPEINEEQLKQDNHNLNPRSLAVLLAKSKALSLTDKFSEKFILGCDQVCIFNDKIMSKPLNEDKAISNLKELSGNTHTLFGAYCVTKGNEIIIEHQIECEMEMRSLTDSEIEEYVALDKPLESCGAYKFEANGFKLFKSVIGSLEAINGLPFADLKELIDAKL